MAGIVEVKNKIVGYLNEVKTEAKKVVWPKKSYVIAATIIILIVVTIIGMLVLAMDYGLAQLFKRLLSLRSR